ncbi:MAG: CPBP family intramembrane metalloprotease [Ruminococcaceae bacterium]|nr:CPBP family intramembrane metalloprotease [Oscillospiraceae bacterium]
MKASVKRNLLLAFFAVSLLVMLVLEFMRDGIVALGEHGENLYLISTRALGAFACIVLVLLSRAKKILYAKPTLSATLCFVPCMLIAINNFPFITFFSGRAYIDASARSVLLYALVCVCVGLFEEMAFRGCVFTAVLQRMGKRPIDVFWSIAISSAVFGIVHLLNLFAGAGIGSVILQVGYSFLIGGMCSVILIKTKNIWYCVLLHAVYNFAGGVVPECGGGEIWDTPTIVLTTIVALVVAAFVIYLLVKIRPEEVTALLNDTKKSEQNIIENTEKEI